MTLRIWWTDITGWDRFAVGASALGVTVVVVAAVLELTSGGGWGFVIGYTALYTGAALIGLSVLSLVMRLSFPPAERRWSGVWMPLAAVTLCIALLMGTTALMAVLSR